MDMNKSIKCMVESCQHHANAANYCCLDCITVGTHECNPSVDQCTDCMSFHASFAEVRHFPSFFCI